MTAELATDRVEDLQRQLDSMSAKLDLVVAELNQQRLRRQQWEDFVADATPLAGEAMAIASRELDEVRDFVEPADLLRLLRRILRNTNNIEEGLAKYESAMEFLSDAGPLANQAVLKLLSTMEDYERRGYFEFADATLGVVDRIVTNYDRDDVDALGDNIVHMLDIVKSLTQPEMLAVAERLLAVVQRQQQVAEVEPEEPPSLLALAGQMRDPEVRRGMARALNTFKAVSASETQSAAEALEATANESPEGGA